MGPPGSSLSLPSSLSPQGSHCRCRRRVAHLPLAPRPPMEDKPTTPTPCSLSSLPPASLPLTETLTLVLLLRAPARRAAAVRFKSPTTTASPSESKPPRSSAPSPSSSPTKESRRGCPTRRRRPSSFASGRHRSRTRSPPPGLPVPRRPRHHLRGELLTRMGLLPLPLSLS